MDAKGGLDAVIKTVYHVAGVSLRLALLADIHGEPHPAILPALRKRAAQHSSDIICIAGDLVNGIAPVDDLSPLITQPAILPFLEACVDIAPTYLSLGNHECFLDDADLEKLARTGVTILDNEWKTITVSGRNIAIGGLTSATVLSYRRFRNEHVHAGSAERYPKRPASICDHAPPIPDISWLSTVPSNDLCTILLSHHPEYYTLAPEGVTVVLSGHAHGGQWRFYDPFHRCWRGVWCPGQGFLPPFTRGVYDDRLVVSAGLANTVKVPRICNPLEIVFVE